MIAVEGCELILGSSLDPQFGPILLFGAGGQLGGFQGSRARAAAAERHTCPPGHPSRHAIFAALKDVRGRGQVDLAVLDELLIRFSRLVTEQRWIKEIDINLLAASASGLLALDARMILHSPRRVKTSSGC